MKTMHRTLALSSAPLCITGCLTIGPDYEPPSAELNGAWSQETESMFQRETSPQPDWWKALGDPILAGLVDEALAQNLTLENAALRVLEARVERRLRYQLLAPIPLPGASVTHVDLSRNV